MKTGNEARKFIGILEHAAEAAEHRLAGEKTKSGLYVPKPEWESWPVAIQSLLRTVRLIASVDPLQVVELDGSEMGFVQAANDYRAKEMNDGM